MTNNHSPYYNQTKEEVQARRHYWINLGHVCTARTCEGPSPDEHGSCENCGYPITQETLDSWQGFEPAITDTIFKEILENLFATPLVP